MAKPLAFGVAPYWTLLGGFTATIVGFIAVTQYCEKRRVDAHHHNGSDRDAAKPVAINQGDIS